MKSNIFASFLAVFLITSFAHAVTWEISDPCTGKVRHQGREILNQPFPSVGHLTVAVLKKSRIEFVGGEGKIHSIYNTPVGESSVEVKDAQNMWAYGWCYTVNGVELGLMPHQVMIKSQQDHIKWFYAFTELKNGQWLTMCRPASERPFKAICR